MRILFLAGRERSYARVSILRKGLLQNEVTLLDGTVESKSLPYRALCLLQQFLFTPGSAYDCIFVGFLGQPFVPILRRLTRKPIILDAFMSVYNTAVEDKAVLKSGSFSARLAEWLDRRSTIDADVVLFDTEEHIRYFMERYAFSRERFERVLIGTDQELFHPMADLPSPITSPIKNGKLHVLFYGGYIPLQGVEYIVRAAKLLEHQSQIQFRLVGKGQTYASTRALADSLGLTNLEFVDAVPPDRVPFEIAAADIGLGIFGDTRKTQMVIPNKVFELAGMGKPIITADTPAIRELFTHQKDVWTCPHADPEALAGAILTLANNAFLRSTIASNGYQTIVEHATQKILGAQLKATAESVARRVAIRNLAPAN